MRVALVHDWLTGMRGGERVLERLCRIYPDARIYTLLHVPGSTSPEIERHEIRTSWVQRLPGAARHYRSWLPLHTLAIERLALDECDLVVSSTHCVAHGIRVPPDVPHLSYVYTPARYAWDLREEYLSRMPRLAVPIALAALAGFRSWDRRASRRPNAIATISRAAAARIERAWGREARVIHPPVEIARFTRAREPEDFYAVLGATAPYKRIEDAILACARLGRRLVVTGGGPFAASIARRFASQAEFPGWVSDDDVEGLLSRARALIHAGEEDFGLGMVEALAAGCPVVALGRGGALDSVGAAVSDAARGTLGRGGVIETSSGVLYGTPGADSLVGALRSFESLRFDAHTLRGLATPFAAERFDREMSAECSALVARSRSADTDGGVG